MPGTQTIKKADSTCTCSRQVAPTRLRGALGALNQLIICTGILAVLLVNVALPVTQWRSFFLMGCVPAVLLLLGTRVGAWGLPLLQQLVMKRGEMV